MTTWSLPDARYFQIGALGALLTLNFTLIDFGAQPLASAIATGTTLITQFICARITGTRFDWRSAMITGLSLSLLLRADALWLFVAAGVLAISCKFVLRIDGKHIFNPAGLAIVILLLTTNHIWISPGQWGTEIWFAALTGGFAVLVLSAARRGDIAIFFLASHAALLFARAHWLGDPLAIPVHQLQSGSLLIFTFFMISDPRTAPDSVAGRFLFAFSVAALAHYMAFFMQMRPALYFALILLSPLTLMIDYLIPAKRFSWAGQTPQGVSQ